MMDRKEMTKMNPLNAMSGVRFALGIVCVLGFSACGAGPLSIKGRIIDDKDTPIQKAEIATQPETDVVVSNSRGFFLLRQRITELGETKPIEPGRYRVTVRKFGFEDLRFFNSGSRG